MNEKNEKVELVEYFEEELNKVWKEAIAARDAAQATLETIKDLRQALTKKSISILQGK